MKSSKLSLNFARQQDAVLLNNAEVVLTSMTDNPVFPGPVPALAALSTAIDNYNQALIAAMNFGRLEVAEKRASRKILEGILKQLGMYVMYVANGEPGILVSSGFALAKTPAPTHLVAPEMVILKNGPSTGMLLSSVKLVKGASAYQHEITPDPLTDESAWKSNASKRARNIFTNLQPGTKYWVRVAAIGSGSQLVYSPVTSQYAQ